MVPGSPVLKQLIMKFKVIDFETRNVSYVKFPTFLPPMDLTGIVYRANGKSWKVLRVEFAGAIATLEEKDVAMSPEIMNNFITTLYVTEIPII